MIPRFKMANMEAFLQEMRGFASATTQAVSKLSEKKPEAIDARTLQKPEVWKPKDHDEEMSGWPEWSFLFKTFMGMLDADYEQDLDLVENDLKKEMKLEDYEEKTRTRARRLYSYLVSYVKERPLRIVRAVTTSDGYKAWQHLCRVSTKDSAEDFVHVAGNHSVSRLRERQELRRAASAGKVGGGLRAVQRGEVER